MSRINAPYPGVTYELHDEGDGSPVLLLHGGGGPESVANLGATIATNHRVLAPTHPGWGQSERPDWFSGIDRLAELYLDLLDDLGLADVDVVGSSMGGWLGAEMAIRDRGRRIGRLVLIDASGLPDHEPTFPAPQPGSEWSERLVTMQELLGAYGVSDRALPARLHRISAPTLVVWGADDPIISTEAAHEYASAVPDAVLEIIDGAGHVPTLEQPDKTIPKITQFLTP